MVRHTQQQQRLTHQRVLLQAIILHTVLLQLTIHQRVLLPRLTHLDQHQGQQTFMPKDTSVSDNLDSAHARSISGASRSTEEFKQGTTTIGWHSKMSHLVEVEEYLQSKFPYKGIKLAYDCTAVEDLYFNTVNYTTFAGFLMLHPMSFEQSLRQMADAYADTVKPVGHIDWIKNKIEKEQTFSKYDFKIKKASDAKEALVVLPGTNKIKKHCCVGKIQHILNKHGRENVLFKRHPISYTKEYEELDEYLGGINFADKYSDLFELIKDSDFIYSTMISESALTAYILDKEVGHIDLLQNRHTTSFGHINYYLYSHPNPVEWANKTFASPKSGIIHPAIEKNWMKKVDDYLEYISQLRDFYVEAYRLS